MPWPPAVDRLQQLPKWCVVVGLVVFVGLVACVDILVVDDVSLRLLYVPAIVLAAWAVGLGWAAALSLLVSVFAVFGEATRQQGEWICLWEPLVHFGMFCCLAVSVWLLRRAVERERQLARSDFLTGLFNSRSFLKTAEAELNRSRRSGRPITVAFVDCDDFKAVNDSFGHLRGDELLKTIAATMRSSTRSYDVAARLGGDEFALLLPETAAESATTVVTRVHERLISAMQSNAWPVTFSIGVVTFTEPPETASELIRAADELMYAVKRAGKAGVKYDVVGLDAGNH